MYLYSLSVRAFEPPLDKCGIGPTLEQFAAPAAEAGYKGLALRPSQLPTPGDTEGLASLRRQLDDLGLQVSSLTTASDVLRNDANAGRHLWEMASHLDVADALGAALIRVSVPNIESVSAARYAADQAAERGIRLAQQIHAMSPFETVDEAAEVLKMIDRPNFGLIFEPANMLLCGGALHKTMLRPVHDKVFDVYLQNYRPAASGTAVVTNRGERFIRHTLLSLPGEINFRIIAAALNDIQYSGWLTAHNPYLPGVDWRAHISDSVRLLGCISRWQ